MRGRIWFKVLLVDRDGTRNRAWLHSLASRQKASECLCDKSASGAAEQTKPGSGVLTWTVIKPAESSLST